MVAGEAGAPLDLFGSVTVRAHDAGELDVVVTMPSSHRVGVAGLGEAFLAVLADGLQQPEAGIGAGVVGNDQRPGDKVREQLQDVVALDRITGADRFGRVERAAPGKGRQAVQESLLGFAQEVVGPVDGGPQRLVTFDRAAVAAGEQPEPPVQSSRQLGGVHRGDARRRQFDRQRDTVEPSTHLRDRVGVAGVDLETGLRALRPLDEQADGLTRTHSGEIGRVVGYLQRRHRDELLAANAQSLTAGRQHPNPRTRPLDRSDQCRDRAQQVLTVVQHDQQLLVAQVRDEGLFQRHPRTGADLEHRRDRVHRPSRVAHRRQLAQPRTVRGIDPTPPPRPAARAGSCRHHLHR